MLRELVSVDASDGVPLALTRVAGRRSNGHATLLVHGFGQNRFLFDLPQRSFAAFLAGTGLEVYVLELRGHGRSPVSRRNFVRGTFEYADLDLPAAVAALHERGIRDISLIGHSMGGVACMAAPRSLLASMRSVVVMAAPTHFGRGAPNVRVLSALAAQVVRSLRYRGRVLPAEHIGTVARVFREYFDRPLPTPLRFWHPGQIEPEVLRPYLAQGFDPEATGVFLDLARWSASGRFDRAPGQGCIREQLGDYPAPILFVAAKQDYLVPPASIRPGFELTRAPLKAWRLYGGAAHRGRYGHVDLILGRHAPNEVWPQLADWLHAT